MNYLDMPEKTEEQRLKKDIAECYYCINGLCKTMKQMRVPQSQWKDNVMIKKYLARIEKNEEKLKEIGGNIQWKRNATTII